MRTARIVYNFVYLSRGIRRLPLMQGEIQMPELPGSAIWRHKSHTVRLLFVSCAA